MNNQPISPEVIAEAQALLAFAMSIPREIAEVFFDFSPHVGVLYANAHFGGWRAGKDADYYVRADLKGDEAPQRLRIARDNMEVAVRSWAQHPPEARETMRAKSLREAAQKLMAEAESLTQPAISDSTIEEVRMVSEARGNTCQQHS